LVGLVLGGLIIRIAWAPVTGSQDLMERVLVTIASLFLLSPSQFPWYLIWLQPLLCVRPVRGWLLATVLLPLYYVSFYFYATDRAWIFREVVVWAIWVPIWALLIWDCLLTDRQRQAQRHRAFTAVAALRTFVAKKR
jgi:alpha-1,6-mannosyltransferase